MPSAEAIARLLDIEGASKYMSVSVWTIRDLIASGTLKRVMIPLGGRDVRRVLLDRRDIDALIDRVKEQA
jgi:excisionase family DNA binding protein